MAGYVPKVAPRVVLVPAAQLVSNPNQIYYTKIGSELLIMDRYFPTTILVLSSGWMRETFQILAPN